MANRKRNNEIKVRFTDDEFRVLLQRMSDADYTVREKFIRKMVLQGYILRLDMSEVRAYVRYVAKAAENINQIARRTNETRSIYANDMIELQEQCDMLRKEARNVYDIFVKVEKFLG